MKVSVLQPQLKEALGIVSRAVDARPAVPILSNILLRTEGGRLLLTGSNLDHMVTVAVGAAVDTPGEITLPAKTFAELVGSLPPERIDLTLNADTNTVAIKCGKARSTVRGQSAVESPPLPDVIQWQLQLPAALLKRMIQGVAICAAKEDNRPILTGIYMQLEGGNLVMAAADGYRLAVMRAEIASDLAFTQVVPAAMLKEFARVLTDDDDSTVSIAFDQSSIHLEHQQVTASIQTLEGKFPDFEALLPRHWNTRATLYRDDLLRACKRAEIFARDSNYSVRLEFKPADAPGAPGEINVLGKSAERGDLEALLDASVEGDALSAAYNVRYIMDILNALRPNRWCTTRTAKNTLAPSRPLATTAITRISSCR